MSKKKKKDKKKSGAAPASDLEAVVQQLREENEMLRARLEKIGELAGDLPGRERDDDEDDEYDELTRDVDDLITDGNVKRVTEPAGVIVP
jgi:hypothetical protein